MRQYLCDNLACRGCHNPTCTEGAGPERVWATCKNLNWYLRLLRHLAYQDLTKLRLFACECAREVWSLLSTDDSRIAVGVSEMYARGQATAGQLKIAHKDSVRAISEVLEGSAAWAAAWAAERACLPSAWDSVSAAHWAAGALARADWESWCGKQGVSAQLPSETFEDWYATQLPDQPNDRHDFDTTRAFLVTRAEQVGRFRELVPWTTVRSLL